MENTKENKQNFLSVESVESREENIKDPDWRAQTKFPVCRAQRKTKVPICGKPRGDGKDADIGKKRNMKRNMNQNMNQIKNNDNMRNNKKNKKNKKKVRKMENSVKHEK